MGQLSLQQLMRREVSQTVDMLNYQFLQLLKWRNEWYQWKELEKLVKMVWCGIFR